MKKIIVGVVSNMLMVLLPLVFKPQLMLDFRIWIILAGGFCIWLTQPVFTFKETADNKKSDGFSILLILIASFISVAAPVTHWAYFLDARPSDNTVLFTGIILMLLGLSMRAWAVIFLGKYFTPTVQIQNEHKLITGGPYKIVRHPSYTGAYLAIIAPAIVLHSWPGLIIAIVAMTVAYYVRINVEEKALISYFGNDYLEYKSATKTIIPFIW